MISLRTAALLCAVPLAALAQISPCGVGQQLGNNAVITSGNAVYSSPGYVSAGSLSVNVVGNSVTGNGSVTIKAGTAICLGPGFKAAATSSGGGFTALIGSTPPAGAFAVTTTSLAGANQGASYQQTLNASGGIAPYTWSQAGGSLPPGMSLNSAGVIAGTAAVGGTYAFVAQVQDAAGATVVQTLSINVAAVNPPSLSINGGSGNGQTLAT
jgi:Putative Ig domain